MAMPMSARVRTGASLMPSPTKASLSFVAFSASSFSTSADLVARQKLAVDLVDAQLACDLLGYAARVAREHDGLGDTGLLEAGNGLGGVRLDDIGDDDMPGVDCRRWPCG